VSETALKPDRVIVTRASGTAQLSVGEFQKIPLHEQVELLMKGNITFFAGQTKLRTVDALRVLRTAATQG
jgi:hypothetical protein